MKKYRIKKIEQAAIKKPYVYLFIFIMLLYLTINFIVNRHDITAPTFFNLNPLFVTFFIIFQLLIATLVAINVNLIIITLKEMPKLAGGSFTLFGFAGGIIGGACPGCIIGLFPSFIGLFGISYSFAKLPFYVVGIQAVSILLLIIGLILITRPITCNIKEGKK